jgi:7,8-dihydropterin-6-yl-methyl-4-(beta-D-ribofuranosyl)aminobenzene 5'-phosphate synthase
MEITILFDSKGLNRKFRIGWGVSYLINGQVLFDTGERSSYLFRNMEHMGINISDIKSVVISHDHWDHINGLWDLLRERPGLDIYVCSGFSKEFRNKLEKYKCNIIEAESFMRIADGIYTTGQIEGMYHFDYIAEQALVLETDRGLTIVTGCAHPGIIKIVEYVMNNIKKHLYLIMGGLHLLNKSAREINNINNTFRQLGIENVGPTHCTGEEAIVIFKESYKANCIDVKVGKTIEV